MVDNGHDIHHWCYNLVSWPGMSVISVMSSSSSSSSSTRYLVTRVATRSGSNGMDLVAGENACYGPSEEDLLCTSETNRSVILFLDLKRSFHEPQMKRA